MLAFPKVHADFPAHGDDEATVLMLASALPEASSVLRTLLGAPDLAADSGLKNMRGRRKSAATCARADLRRKDARGRTALFYAAEADRAENVELLLSLGGARRRRRPTEATSWTRCWTSTRGTRRARRHYGWRRRRAREVRLVRACVSRRVGLRCGTSSLTIGGRRGAARQVAGAALTHNSGDGGAHRAHARKVSRSRGERR